MSIEVVDDNMNPKQYDIRNGWSSLDAKPKSISLEKYMIDGTLREFVERQMKGK